MEWLPWIVGLALFALFIWVAGINAIVFWEGHIQKKKTSSWTPLFAGICGAIALAVLPIPGARSWWWMPFLLDWGSAPGILYNIAYYAFQAMKKSD